VELTNEFTVGVPVDQAWAVLTDLERIAPCMPGAELQEVEGDEYRGIVKVKVGPITAQYKGAASFVEKDDAAHKAVIRAEGRDTRGQGNASATITATLEPAGDGTHVKVLTDLTVTGKVAQFGRGVMADVSAKLLDQFVQCLESNVLAGDGPAPAAETPPVETTAPSPGAVPSDGAASTAGSAGPRKIDSKPAEPVDLLGTAGSPVVKRVGPIVGVVVVLLWLLRRRKKKM
jgi:carbon monoxide dehydrogenase subunit G